MMFSTAHSLPFRELRYEYIASIWKFDRIMVTMRNIWVYRAEFPYSEISCARPNPSVVVFDIAGERQFGPRKHTDRYGEFTFSYLLPGLFVEDTLDEPLLSL